MAGSDRSVVLHDVTKRGVVRPVPDHLSLQRTRLPSSQTNWFAKVQGWQQDLLCMQNAPLWHNNNIRKGGRETKKPLAWQTEQPSRNWPVESPNSTHTPHTPVWFERSLCVWENGLRIQSFIKGHYFFPQRHLTYTCTQSETGGQWRGPESCLLCSQNIYHVVICYKCILHFISIKAFQCSCHCCF